MWKQTPYLKKLVGSPGEFLYLALSLKFLGPILGDMMPGDNTDR